VSLEGGCEEDRCGVCRSGGSEVFSKEVFGGKKGKFETSVERSERLLKGGLRYSGRRRDKLRSNEKKDGVGSSLGLSASLFPLAVDGELAEVLSDEWMCV